MANRRLWRYGLLHGALLMMAVIWMLPLALLFLASIRSSGEFYANLNLFSLPKRWEWNNYLRAFFEGGLGRYMANGLLVTGIKVPLGIGISSLCAYGLSRRRLPMAEGIFLLLLVGMMLPLQLALIPLNVAFSRLGWTNTYFGLLLAYVGFGLPLGVLVFRGFFRSIPKEMDEAAYMDGCGVYGLYWHILLPMAKPAAVTLCILDFLHTWNEYLLQSVLITRDTMKTVPYGLLGFVGEFTTDYGLLAAGVLISLLPVFFLYIFFQRYFVEGFSGAVKG